MIAQGSPYEAEWLSTNIFSLVETLTQKNCLHPRFPQLDSLTVLLNLRPIVVKSSALEVPRHWKNEQAHSTPLHISDTHVLQSSSPLNIPSHRIYRKESGSFTPSPGYAVSSPHRTHAEHLETCQRFAKERPQCPGAGAPSCEHDQRTKQSLKFSEPTTAGPLSQGGLYPSVVSGDSDEALASSSDPVHFAHVWGSNAMTQLNLSSSASAQIEFLHGLVVDCYRAMSASKLLEEKVRVKSKLKEFDKSFSRIYGRWPTRNDKEPLRGLYTYYRRVKLSIAHLMMSLSKLNIGPDPSPVPPCGEFKAVDNSKPSSYGRSRPSTYSLPDGRQLRGDGPPAISAPEPCCFFGPQPFPPAQFVSSSSGKLNEALTSSQKHFTQKTSSTMRALVTDNYSSEPYAGRVGSLPGNSSQGVSSYAASDKPCCANENEQFRATTPSDFPQPHDIACDSDDSAVQDKLTLLQLQEDRAKIRDQLQEYQRQFYKREGRLLKYHRDITAVAHEYKRYKVLRERIHYLTNKLRNKGVILDQG